MRPAAAAFPWVGHSRMGASFTPRLGAFGSGSGGSTACFCLPGLWALSVLILLWIAVFASAGIVLMSIGRSAGGTKLGLSSATGSAGGALIRGGVDVEGAVGDGLRSSTQKTAPSRSAPRVAAPITRPPQGRPRGTRSVAVLRLGGRRFALIGGTSPVGRIFVPAKNGPDGVEGGRAGSVAKSPALPGGRMAVAAGRGNAFPMAERVLSLA